MRPARGCARRPVLDVHIGARLLKVGEKHPLLHTDEMPAVPLDQPLGDNAQVILHIAAPAVGRQQRNAAAAALRAAAPLPVGGGGGYIVVKYGCMAAMAGAASPRAAATAAAPRPARGKAPAA